MKNEPAFPINKTINDSEGNFMVAVTCTGLTKREYFAAAAMQGLLSCGDYFFSEKSIVEEAVVFADVLIAELEKEAK